MRKNPLYAVFAVLTLSVGVIGSTLAGAPSDVTDGYSVATDNLELAVSTPHDRVGIALEYRLFTPHSDSLAIVSYSSNNTELPRLSFDQISQIRMSASIHSQDQGVQEVAQPTGIELTGTEIGNGLYSVAISQIGTGVQGVTYLTDIVVTTSSHDSQADMHGFDFAGSTGTRAT